MYPARVAQNEEIDTNSNSSSLWGIGNRDGVVSIDILSDFCSSFFHKSVVKAAAEIEASADPSTLGGCHLPDKDVDYSVTQVRSWRSKNMHCAFSIRVYAKPRTSRFSMTSIHYFSNFKQCWGHHSLAQGPHFCASRLAPMPNTIASSCTIGCASALATRAGRCLLLAIPRMLCGQAAWSSFQQMSPFAATTTGNSNIDTRMGYF